MLVYGLAFVLSFVGVTLLFLRWRLESNAWYTLTAWLIIGGASVLWTLPGSTEFGICYALIALTLQAWIIIALKHPSARAEKRVSLPQRPIRWAHVGRTIPRQLVLFLIAVPLAAMAAIQSTVVSTLWLPWNIVNLMALGIYAMPVVWGFYAYWACMARRAWQPALTFVLLILVCSFVIHW